MPARFAGVARGDRASIFESKLRRTMPRPMDEGTSGSEPALECAASRCRRTTASTSSIMCRKRCRNLRMASAVSAGTIAAESPQVLHSPLSLISFARIPAYS